MSKINWFHWMGSDLTVVNAAKASFAKSSTEMSRQDQRLIQFLGEHGHTSPFRHAVIQIEVETTLEERMLWETRQANVAGQVFKPSLGELIENGHFLVFGNPLQMKMTWRWTASLQAVCQFYQQFHDHPLLARYAKRIGRELRIEFPYSTQALTGEDVAPPTLSAIDAPEFEIHLPVLDKGYVHYVDHLSGPTDDESVLTLEIKAPIGIVRNQWFKYVRNSVHTPQLIHPFDGEGSGNGDDCDWDAMYARNEMSRRYVTVEPEFYIPAADQWRGAPANAKQGSSGLIDPAVGESLTQWLQEAVGHDAAIYNGAVARGVAPEQVRVFLHGYALYTNWYWTASLSAVKFFLAQRLAHDAQAEINLYAQAVDQIVKEVFQKGEDHD